MVDSYIQIEGSETSYSPINISRGELVYFSDLPSANSYFSALLGENEDVGLIVRYDSKIINQLSASEMIYNKRRIAYISNEMALLSSESVGTNIKLYLKSIDHKAGAVVDQFLQHFNIDQNKIVLKLNDLDVFVVRIAIGLAKDPELLILDNPYGQISPSAYRKLMNLIYEMILENDLTCLCSLSSKKLSEDFPGRFID